MVYNNFASPIHQRLAEMGLTYDAKARVKSVYSIWRKMETKRIPFEEVYDLFAFRVLVDSVADCYNVLGVIHDLYRPILGRFKDYIATPNICRTDRPLHSSSRAHTRLGDCAQGQWLSGSACHVDGT